MAEGFEPYHVPQQSRRDMLRIVAQNHSTCVESTAVSLSACSGLLPLYDASLLSSDLLTCAANQLSASASGKQGVNSMAFVGGSSPASHHHLYLDAQSSLPANPSSIQDIIFDNPFLYTLQNLQNVRVFDQSFNSGPLSLNHESSATGQALSLSLSSAIYSDKVTATGYGPLTDYASVLEGSRFLRPAQQLLEQLSDVGRGLNAENFTPDSSLMDPSIFQSLNATGIIDDSGESRRKKSRLISMLDEVYRIYKQYYQQIQAAVASFEYVAGLGNGNAAPFANLALKAMSKHFRCLNKAITDQLQFVNKPHGDTSPGKEEGPMFESSERSHELRPVWRPQRGLPERAVTVLRAWLFEHFLHPYPTDKDKLNLAKQTGLSRNQVSNWFINARVRLWKPMVEEIHMLEQAQKGTQKEYKILNKSRDHMCSTNYVAHESPSTSTQRVQDMPLKRIRSESLSDIPLESEPLNLSYNSLSSHQHVGTGVSVAGGSNGVSLTLGLHQNNGGSLSQPFPMSAAQGFSLGLSSEGYVIGGFEAQNRHFGRDVIGGQLLHESVG